MFARRQGGSWEEVEHVAFGLESELELLLAESAELLPGRPTNLALVRQFFIPSITGYLDLCGVASDGSIYLIECKLAGNPDMRRTIVGQLLAYAAGIATLSAEDFVQQFAAAAKNSGRPWSTPASRFDQLPDAERDADYDAARLGERLRANLEAGRFHLLFAVDRLPDELGLIVDYLERQMNAVSVSALEMRFSRFGDVEIAAPTLHGAQYETSKASPTLLATTTLPDFDAAQARLSPHVQVAFQQIRDAATTSGGTLWGLRKPTPTIGATYECDGREVTPWVMSARQSKPGFGVMWGWMRGAVPEDRLRALYAEVKELPGAEIWRGVDRNWNYVNYLDAEMAFRDPATAPALIAAVHRALGSSS
jgi:hypothetical protein